MSAHGKPKVALALRALTRRDILSGAGVLAACLLLYGLGARPHLFVGDSPELSAAAATFGVAHPPGYPLYTMVTGLGVRALFWLEPAHAANVMSGVYAAGAVTLLWLLLRRLAAPAVACTFAAGSLALGATFMAQATAAEVYTLDALLLMAAAHGALTLTEKPRGRAWLLAGLALGLWLGHRPNNLLHLPAVVLLWQGCGGRLADARGGAAARLAAGLLLAALPYLYLPLASARDPLVDMGDPETPARFWAVVSAAPFRGLLGGVAPDVAIRRVGLLLLSLPLESGLAALAAAAGAVRLWKRGRARLVLAVALVVIPGVAFVALYDILDYDAYLLPALCALCALAAAGAAELLDRVDRLGRPGLARLAAAVVVLLGLVGALFNAGRTPGGPGLARRLAADTLASVPSDALLLVHGDTAAGALDYLQAVERRAPGVAVIRVDNLTPWYADNLARRFPDDPWPALAPATPPGQQAHRIMLALGKRRPVYVTLSVDPRSVLPRGSRLGMVPRGLVREVRPRGTRVRIADRALEDARRLLASARSLPRPGPRADLDLRSIYLQYALALLQTAEALGRVGQRDRAQACLDALLQMKPNIQDVQLRHEVMIRGGRSAPYLRLEQKARVLKWRLDGRIK